MTDLTLVPPAAVTPSTPEGPMHGRCGAKLRGERAGKRCRNRPVLGARRCRMHGGKAKRGPEAAGFKHGAYSRHMPKRLMAAFLEASRDGALASLQSEMGLVMARVVDLLDGLGGTGDLAHWREAHAAFAAFKAAGSNVDVARVALARLEAVLDRGLRDEVTWSEIYEAVDLKRKLSEAEARRLRDLHQMISVQTALGLMNQLVVAVKQVVGAKVLDAGVGAEILTVVSREFMRLTA